MKLDVYEDVFEALVKHNFHNVSDGQLNILRERLIQTAESTQEYQDLLHRGRLFITEHGDIADTDLAQVLCLGLPTLTYKRFPFSESTGIQHSAIKASRLLDSEIDLRIEEMNKYRVKEEWGLHRIIRVESVPKWNFAAFENMYLKTWDMLLDWAQNGTVYKEMNEAMLGGYWNCGVRSDPRGFDTLMSIKKNMGHI